MDGVRAKSGGDQFIFGVKDQIRSPADVVEKERSRKTRPFPGVMQVQLQLGIKIEVILAHLAGLF